MIKLETSTIYITSNGRKFLDREEAISVERGLMFAAFAEAHRYEDFAFILEEYHKELHDLLTKIERLDSI